MRAQLPGSGGRGGIRPNDPGPPPVIPRQLSSMGRGGQVSDPESPEFAVRHLKRSIEGKVIHADLSFSLKSGETLFIQGPSGVGKSVLLRCLASLDPIDSGDLTLAGKTPDEYGLPRWRSLVCYVHQQRIALPGTPRDFFERVTNLQSQKGRPRGDLTQLVSKLGLEEETLDQPWQELSVSEANECAGASVQRVLECRCRRV